MSVHKDASGRRSVQVEVEVPGTPEQVWQAIASGPGISSWFVPSEVDGRVGGSIVHHFGPGMDSSKTITNWDPPHRVSAEGAGIGPGMPPMATEWTVEARAGGTCIVRVVHSLFASTDDWDKQLESVESGWPAIFLVLHLYLSRFAGQECSGFNVMGFTPGPVSRAWLALTDALGLTGVAVGNSWTSRAGVPRLAGRVERLRDGEKPYALLLVKEPAPAAVMLSANSMGGQVYIPMMFYFYGGGAATAATRDEPLWRSWMNEHVAPGAGAGSGG
ncbi:MAG TPA: SRPBCC domain-containing protein [Gemmatimonadaceae bacterium]